MHPNYEEEMLFHLDGVPDLQACTQQAWPLSSTNSMHQWRADLSPLEAQVLLAAERSVKAAGDDKINATRLAELLNVELPSGSNVRVRRGAPKKAASVAEDATWGLRNLRHTFLVVQLGPHQELVVESSFRAHFEIPGASPAFVTLLQRLPDVLVAPVRQLARLIHEMANLMAMEYSKQGRTVPPWRTASAMLSKWLPSHYVDTPLPASVSAAAAGPAQPSVAVTTVPASMSKPHDLNMMKPTPELERVPLAQQPIVAPPLKHTLAPEKIVRGFEISARASTPPAAAAAQPASAPLPTQLPARAAEPVLTPQPSAQTVPKSPPQLKETAKAVVAAKQVPPVMDGDPARVASRSDLVCAPAVQQDGRQRKTWKSRTACEIQSMKVVQQMALARCGAARNREMSTSGVADLCPLSPSLRTWRIWHTSVGGVCSTPSERLQLVPVHRPVAI